MIYFIIIEQRYSASRDRILQGTLHDRLSLCVDFLSPWREMNLLRENLLPLAEQTSIEETSMIYNKYHMLFLGNANLSLYKLENLLS